jgi:hypothetical protein
MKEEKMENQPNPPTSEKPKKSEKAARVKKDKRNIDGIRLPVLVEFTYTISVLLLIVLVSTIILISILNGASLFTLVLRASVAMFVMGGLLALISSQVSSGLLFSTRVEQEEYEETQSEEFENSAGIEGPGTAEAS